MAFPSDDKIKEILPELEKSEGTLALNPGASQLELFRWNIHQKFVQYKQEKAISQRELAKILEVDEAKVSKILHHRLDEFSTDRLINLLEKISPDFKLKVS